MASGKDFRPKNRTLERRITATRAALGLEAFAQAFWPVWTILFGLWAVLAFGVLEGWHPNVTIGVVVAALIGVIWFVVRGIRQFRTPGRSDAVNRMDSRLPGRPLAAIEDTQAIGASDPASRAVWHAHVDRMLEASRAAKTARPDLRLAGRDPWGLRLIALVALIAAVLFARGSVTDGLTASLDKPSEQMIAAGPSFEVWVSPPGYTGRPTIYLTEAATDTVLDVPINSLVTFRTYGSEAEFSLSETLSADGEATLSEIATGIQSAEFPVQRSGAMTLREGEEEVGIWTFEVVEDLPPDIGLEEEVTRAVSGAMELTFRASDDYGVTHAWGEIGLNMDQIDRRYGQAVEPVDYPVIEFDLPLPFSGGTEEFTETLLEDYIKHPWAGMPVTLELHARDAADQSGSSPVEEIILPGRRFFDPMAAAVIEQRRDLLWSPENAARVDQMLRAATHAPEDVFDNMSAYLMVRTALRRLGYAREDELTKAEIEDVAEVLWQAALLIEDGSLSDAAERLRRAQERLAEALENGATDEEIAELTEELRQAMQDYMQQLAEQALENPQEFSEQQGDPLSADILQEMLDRIQELSEEGRQEEAMALLQQLQQMLENLQMQAQQGNQGQEGQQGQQLMQELQDTLRQQQDLADESFQELQEQFRQQRQGQGQPQPGEQPGQQQGQGQQQGESQQSPNGQPRPGDGPNAGNRPGQTGQTGNQRGGPLSQRQEALRRLLNDLRGRLPGAGTDEGQEARRALREAERNMEAARDNLQSGDLSEALDEQAEALDRLRDGMQGLNEEMQQAQRNEGQGGTDASEGFTRNDRDPLGRPSGNRGAMDNDDRLLDGIGNPFARSKELTDEIRRRSSEQQRLPEELDYLKRLLDRF